MSVANEFGSSRVLHQAVSCYWYATGIAVLAVTAFVAPRSLHTIVPLLLVLLLSAQSAQGAGARVLAELQAMAQLAIRPIGALLVCYLFIRAVTSPEPGNALKTLTVAAAYVIVMLVMVRLMFRTDATTLHLARRGIVIAVCIGAAFIISELLSRLSLVTAALSQVPVLAGGNKIHFVISGDVIEAVRPYVLDRNVAVLNLLLWPALLIAVRDARSWSAQVSQYALPVICVLVCVATFLSRHESSKVALICATLIFALTRVSPKLGRTIVVAAWMTACLAVVPVVQMAHQYGLQNSELIPGSARARVVLWNYEANQISSNVFFGKGVDSVRHYDELQGPGAQRLPGEMAPQRNGRHSHNVFLQVWYEFGLSGALLFMIAGLIAFQRMSRIDDDDLPFMNATFVTAMTIAAFSWGMWQTWFLAAISLTVGIAAMSLAQHGRAPESYQRYLRLRWA